MDKLALRGGAVERAMAKMLGVSYSPAAIYAHELGHAKSLLNASPTVRKLRMAGYGYGPMAGAVASTVPALMGKPGAAMLTRAAFETPRLVEEVLATKHGLKGLKALKFISPKAYKNARSTLLKAFSTYGLGAAGGVARAGVVGHAAKHGLKGKHFAAYLAGHALPMTGQVAALLSMKKGVNKGAFLSPRQRRALRKAMNMGPATRTKNLTLKGQQAEEAFFSPPIPPEDRREVGRQLLPYLESGVGSLEEALEKGFISVPKKGRVEDFFGLRRRGL